MRRDRFTYNPRLWRKHLLQHHVYSDLDLPELGLSGGESPAEEALWRAAMEGVGVSDAFRAEARRQYQELSEKETSLRALLRKHDTAPDGPYLQVSRICALFEQSARDAGVEGLPDFRAAREQLFWNTLVDFGIYYDLVGAELLRDAVNDFRSGDYEKGISPELPGGRTLAGSSEKFSPDAWIEIGGYARRALELYGPGGLSLEEFGRGPALGRFALHRFKNFLRYLAGGRFARLSDEALLEESLALGQRIRLLDQELLQRLEDLCAGRPAFPPEAEDSVVSMDLEREIHETMLRLRKVVGAIEQAWADNWLSPEERVLLRYLFPHIFGIGERAIARLLNDKPSAQRLCAALRALPIREGEPGYPTWIAKPPNP